VFGAMTAKYNRLSFYLWRFNLPGAAAVQAIANKPE
jgi:hypothetical protein